MNTYTVTLLTLLSLTLGFALCAFGLSRFLGKRDDIADALWGANFMLLAVASYFIADVERNAVNPALIITVMVLLWGARLTISIGRRFIRAKTEDPRYQTMRSKWSGNKTLKSFVRIFVLQSLLAYIIVLPVMLFNLSDTHTNYSVVFFIGMIIWAYGFLVETVADRQLRHFLADSQNKGKILMSGLWKYSRHPNYFGELTQWWALGVIACSVPFGWIGLLGPLALTVLITKVSGVPLAEVRHAEKPGWAAYKARTNVLVLGPVKR